MFPVILVTDNESEGESFIKTQIKKYRIPEYGIYRIKPEKGIITVEQIREIRSEFYLSCPYDRMFIFFDFGNASWEVQNMLLKLLEEQNARNHFVLITGSLYGLLPTVRSRSKIVFQKLYSKQKDFHFETDQINFGSYPASITREFALKQIDGLLSSHLDRLRLQPDFFEVTILRRVLETRTKLLLLNINPALALDNLLIFITRRTSMKAQ